MFRFSEIKDIVKPEKGIVYYDDVVRHIVIDTRRIVSSQDAVFFAIHGKNNDGHLFIEEAYSKGIRNFILEDEHYYTSLKEDRDGEINLLLVKDSISALQMVAAAYRSKFSYPVIGITGSNGKTIIKEWLFQLLYKDYFIVKSPKSYNSQVGVPLSVWQMNAHHNLAIFEAGISQPHEMENLEKVIRPNWGIFSNIGQAHREGFKDKRQKIDEKLQLFKSAELLIYRSDYSEITSAIEDKVKNGFFDKIKLITWSTNENADLTITKIDAKENLCIIRAIWQGKDETITIPFTDQASIENAIHCWVLMLTIGYDSKIISERIARLHAIGMRMELIKGINNCTLINDSYNSDLASLSMALDYLNQQHQHNKKTLIISDILQSGMTPKELYAEVYKIVSKKNIDRIIGIGKDIMNESGLFQGQATFYPDTETFLRSPEAANFKDEAILIKGSRPFMFEKITEKLQQKAHRTVLEINLGALVNNLNVYRSFLKPETKLMVMVKAFAYGSGSYEIASILEFHKVDHLGVAFADEGVALRKAGITLPIMVMNPEKDDFENLVNFNLEPEIYSLKQARELRAFIHSRDNTKINIHLKIETGMNRLGMDQDDIIKFTEEILDETLKIKSVFTHLVASDEEKHDSFSLAQIEKFEKLSTLIMEVTGQPVMRHILNTTGIIRFPEHQFDMVRLGLGLHGIDLTGKVQNLLYPVARLKTTISQIKHVKAGETIGYARKGKAESDMRIATIGIGYADGFNRLMSNGTGYVLINGRKAKVIGNVCMDMTMVDISEIDAEAGDEVIVFGEEPSIQELASKQNTIPYEILTSISERVKRLYYNEL